MRGVILLVAVLIAGTYGITTQQRYQSYNSNGGQYVAIMSSGDVGDFGYNYIINAGRVQMESMRGIADTLWIPNILDNVTAIKVATQLVQNGYRVIVSGTFSHGNAMSYMSTRYPNVTFVQYSSTKTTSTNLSSLSWLNSEFWFAIGVAAGVLSTNNKVGFIHPGLTEGSVQSINAFYSGVKYANPQADVYTMFTGAYIAVDRANGACDTLVNKIGVGALTGQQDDLTVPNFAMASGLLAIGVTGYSLRQLDGELVAVSFVRDWSTSLYNVTAGINATTYVPYHGDITSSFANKGQTIDTPSHLFNTTALNVLQSAILLLSTTNKTLYQCGPWLGKWGLNALGCLPNTTAFNSILYPDVKSLGYYNVPLTNIPFPHATRVGIIAAAAVLLAFPIILAILVILFHKHPEIQAGSPFFFLVMLGGCILIYVGVIIWPTDPSVNMCRARVWLPSMGATIAVAALITKNLRIFLLFFNPFKWRGENLAIWRFLPLVLLFVVMDAIILAIYTGKGAKGVHVEQGTNGLSTYETRHVCASNDAGTNTIYALLVFHMFQIVVGCIISFLLRNVTAAEFNERKAVGMALYVTAFCLIIVAILIGATSISDEQTTLFISSALLICTTGVLLIVFGSRFVDLVMGTVDPTAFASKMTKSASTTTKSKSSKELSDISGETSVVRNAVISSA